MSKEYLEPKPAVNGPIVVSVVNSTPKDTEIVKGWV